jgi:hypothetical protein
MDLRRWTPIRVTFAASGDDPPAVVDWCHTEGIAFDDPFFSQTVDRCLAHPFRLLFRPQTDLDAMCRAVDDQPGLAPAGFVFHMSRCGSTLVAQMLGAVAAHLVLSEPAPIESVLGAPRPQDRERWLRGLVGALGQPRDERQCRLFVKFDAWAVLDLDMILQAFPGVPWIFVSRDPVEVLVSHVRRPGAHVIPGILPAERFGLDPGLPPLEYAARVLAAICEAALARRHDPLATLVDYDELPGFVTSDLARAWALPLDDDARDRMAATASVDAKNPYLPFEPDRGPKRAAATDEIRDAADRWLTPVYARLRQARATV